MADIINTANTESPLLNVLTSSSQRDPFVYSVRSNVGSVSRQRVEVKPSNGTASFDSQSHFNIPRYGLLANAYLRIVLKYTYDKVTGSGANETKLCSAIGLHICKRIDLQTAGKVLESQYPEGAQAYLNSLPAERRNMLKEAVHYDAGSASGTNGTVKFVEIFCPLFMSFSLRSQNFIDTRFVEDLQIVTDLQKSSYIINDCDSKATLAVDDLKLICQYFIPSEKDYRAYQNSNFTLDRPLTMLCRDYYQETPKEITVADVDAASLRTDTVDLRCRNLVFHTMIMIRNKTKYITQAKSTATSLGTYETLNNKATIIQQKSSPSTDQTCKIAIKASGRTLHESGTREMLVMDSAGYGRSADIASNAIQGDDAVYDIWWGLDRSRVSNSGCVSFKNLSAPTLEVTWMPDQSDDTDSNVYEIVVLHEHWSLLDINGSDGSVRKGINL